VKRVLCLSRG